MRRQIEYGAKNGLPWGISESAYNARDLELTYQYSNFGVPGLGLKRGLGENSVVAPYATGLAAMVDPSACGRELEPAAPRWAPEVATVFTKPWISRPLAFRRARHSRSCAPIMAHHQGMTIVAIANALFDGAMRTRFHAEPIVQATELLLQERVPREVPATRPWAAEVKAALAPSDEDPRAGARSSPRICLRRRHYCSPTVATP